MVSVPLVFAVLVLNFGCPGNQPPVIESLTADPSTVEPYDTATVTCEAYDPDGDELTYLWNWSNATVDTVETKTTNYLLWVAPGDTGHYDIEVRVSDGIAIIGPKKTTVVVRDLPPSSALIPPIW